MSITVHTEKLAPHPRSAQGLPALETGPSQRSCRRRLRAPFTFSRPSHPERRRCRHRRCARGLRPAPLRYRPPPARAPPTPTVSVCDWHARAAAPVGLSHWLGPLVSPTMARHCPALLKSHLSIGGDRGPGAGAGRRSWRFRSIAGAQRREGGRQGEERGSVTIVPKTDFLHEIPPNDQANRPLILF